MTSRRSLVPPAEAALALLALATVLSFNRLFVDGTFFGRLAAFAIASHAIATAGRRLGWSLPTTGAVSAAGLVVASGVLLHGSSTLAGLPTGDTIALLRGDLGAVAEQFQAVQAPAPVTTAFLLAAGWAVWWAAFVADWAAFRLWVPFESIVPSGVVFVFASFFAARGGSQDRRTLDAALYLGAALLFVLVHRVARQQVSSGWMTTDNQRSTSMLLRLGGVIAVGAVLIGALVGPSVPQANAEGFYSRNGSTGERGRTVVSPFVDIKKTLLNLTQQEVMTVQSDQRAYWRLTSLDQFDGQVWSSNGSYQSAKGTLPSGVDANPPATIATQTFTVRDLQSIWAPAAFEPRKVDSPQAALRYEPSSGTLIVGNDRQSSDGLTYTVQSALPVFDKAQLQAAPADIPADIRRDGLALPPNMSQRAVTLAQEVTAGRPTAYDKALALQDYFRSQFTYSLDVPAGQSVSAIEEFLDSRAGYCEQFAGTYAAMARAVGLPARVAVGYTTGEADPAVPGLYHVKGQNAHAWPEVYFAGQGWVLFEPTPGRGAPNAEQYTNVPEQQASGGVGVGSTATTLTPTTAAASPAPGATLPTTPSSNPRCATGEPCTSGSGARTSRPQPLARRVLVPAVAALAIGAGLVGLYAAAMLLGREVWRRRRRARATSAEARLEVAWAESIEALAVLGVRPMRSETPAELSARAAAIVGPELAFPLARAVERASYSGEALEEAVGQRSLELADAMREVVAGRTTRVQRLRWALDPRPIDQRGKRVRRAARRRSRRDAPAIEVLSLSP